MIREAKKEDLDLFANWSLKRGFAALRAKDVSNLGFVANECAVIWIYFTNSKLLMVENLLTDPDCCPIKAGRSILALAGAVINVAEKNGYELGTVVSRTRSIDKLCEKLGGKTLDSANVFMFER